VDPEKDPPLFYEELQRVVFRHSAALSEKVHCLQKSVVFALVLGFICGRESRAFAENFDLRLVGCCVFCGMGVAAAV
jgi:hypothetical protein